MSDSFDPMDSVDPPDSFVHGILQESKNSWSWVGFSKNPGVGCHSLLQGVFPTQGSNPGLWHCGKTLYHLSHQESPIFKVLNDNSRN